MGALSFAPVNLGRVSPPSSHSSWEAKMLLGSQLTKGKSVHFNIYIYNPSMPFRTPNVFEPKNVISKFQALGHFRAVFYGLFFLG